MTFLLFLILLLFTLSLHGRVKRLEAVVERHPDGFAPQGTPASSMVSQSVSLSNAAPLTQVQSPLSPTNNPLPSETPDPNILLHPSQESGFDVGAWLAHEWPVKLGAFLVLLGFGWLVSYAFMNDWIGPVGRITLGIVAGVIILLVGYKRIENFPQQGSIFLALGSTITVLTVFAARAVYGYFTPSLAFLFMILVVVFTAFVSVVYNNRALAFLSLVTGGLVPILVVSGQSNFVGLFSYLFLLTAGTLWVVHLRKWHGLALAAWLIVAFYSLPFLIGMERIEPSQKPVAMLFAFLFAEMFYVVNLAMLVRNRKAESLELVVTSLSTLLLLWWIDVLVPETWKSLVLAVTALVSCVGAFTVFRRTNVVAPVLVYSAKAIVLFGVATAYELSGAALSVAYTLEAGVVIGGACLASRSATVRGAFAWLMIIPGVLSLERMDRYSYAHEAFTKDFFALLLVMIVFFVLSGMFRRCARLAISDETVAVTKNAPEDVDSHVATIYLVAGWFYALVLMWQFLHAALISETTATILSLIIYTVIGLFLRIRGEYMKNTSSKMLGNILIGFVTLHLLLVEVPLMSMGGKIITFLAVGTLLMSTAFMGRKK